MFSEACVSHSVHGEGGGRADPLLEADPASRVLTSSESVLQRSVRHPYYWNAFLFSKKFWFVE